MEMELVIRKFFAKLFFKGDDPIFILDFEIVIVSDDEELPLCAPSDGIDLFFFRRLLRKIENELLCFVI